MPTPSRTRAASPARPPCRAAAASPRAKARATALAAALLLAPAATSIVGARTALATLPEPVGEVLLVVRGEIDAPNVGDEAHLDRRALEGLPRHAFVTETPWTDEPHEFEGVRLDVLLEAVGARSDRFEAVGLDDYRVVFESVDLARYPVIVAFRRDGRDLGVRDLGPLWIMFPFDRYPELLTRANTALAVWQLVVMDVR